MAELKVGEPFGVGSPNFEKLNLDLALERIRNDLKTDFIYAPHLSLIYAKAGNELKEALGQDLKNGAYAPELPLTIEVPKSFRIPIVATKRLGPAYSRPGSILLPKDRLLYQAFSDLAVPVVEAGLDAERSFSHQIAVDSPSAMFQPTRKCWNDLQTALSENAASENVQYIMKIDIAGYFNSINQHMLINVLKDSGYEKWACDRLEICLISFTGDRSSRGIIQGVYPSDLFGNYYMGPVDQFLSDWGVKSARYVDDLYVFIDSVDSAEKVLRDLIPFLRAYDLSLNENKSSISPKTLLVTMEPDLEALFQAAVEEISDQVDEEDFDADYGFQSEWKDEDEDVPDDGESDLTLAATVVLFDSVDEYPGHEENVERFCLPLFAKAESNHAVPHVFDAFKKRPAMAQIYSAYLAKFLDDEGVTGFLTDLIQDDSLFDWQRMWVLGGLMQGGEPSDDQVKLAFDILKDGNRHDALRAVAAYFVGRFGTHPRRTSLRNYFAQCSPYIQSAIYASARFWKGPEKTNARATWGNLSFLNQLLTKAIFPAI